MAPVSREWQMCALVFYNETMTAEPARPALRVPDAANVCYRLPNLRVLRCVSPL